MATKKDFIATARIIAAARAEHPGNFPTINLIAEKFARLYADQNSQFDRARFLAACGVEGY